MNIQPGRMNRSSRSSSVRRNPDFGKQACRVLKAVGLLVLIASMLALHIYLNQKISETESRIRAAHLNIDRLEIEITNLRNQYEERCSPGAIRKKIAEFGLNLVPAEPGQVTKMAILSVERARNIARQMERSSEIASVRKIQYRSGSMRRE